MIEMSLWEVVLDNHSTRNIMPVAAMSMTEAIASAVEAAKADLGNNYDKSDCISAKRIKEVIWIPAVSVKTEDRD